MLAADTTYHVFVSGTGGIDTRPGSTNMTLTDSDDEEAGAQQGWSIGNNAYWKSPGNSNFNQITNVLKISITGRYVSGGPPLTATLTETPGDNPDTPLRRFELTLSEEVKPITEHDMRYHVFNVRNGNILSATQLSATHWRMEVYPVHANEKMVISMRAGRPCSARGSLCVQSEDATVVTDTDTGVSVVTTDHPDDKLLDNAPTLEFPAFVSDEPPPPSGVKLKVNDIEEPENRGRLTFTMKFLNGSGTNISMPDHALQIRMRTIAETGEGKAKAGVDYEPEDLTILIPPTFKTWEVDLVTVIQDDVSDADETLVVEFSEAWVLDSFGLRVRQLAIERHNADDDDELESGNTVEVLATIQAPEAQSGSLIGSLTLSTPSTSTKHGTATFTMDRSSDSQGNALCYVFETIDSGSDKGTATPEDDYHPVRREMWMDADRDTQKFTIQAKRDDEDDDNETVKVKISDARYCYDPAKRVQIKGSPKTWTIKEPTNPGGTFLRSTRKHDGRSRFSMRLELNDSVRNTRSDMRDHVVQVRGGQLDDVEPVNEKNDSWEIRVDPDSGNDVTVTVEGKDDCDDPGALCTEDGRPFTETMSATVPGPAPLTVSFENVPDSHDGQTRFDVHLRFSEPPAADVKKSNIKKALQVSGGKKKHVSEVNGDRAHWRIGIEPDGSGDMTLTVVPTPDCALASVFKWVICTEDGRRLEGPVTTTITGPITVSSESYSSRYEGSGTQLLKFLVWLDRASTESVSVEYQTEDGTATAGEDYVAAQGTLTFAAGETEKTVLVSVLDDALEEPMETFGLKLSNAVGAMIVGAPGRGEIHNDDTASTLLSVNDDLASASLTARFTSVPTEHDGSGVFVMRLAFSEAVFDGSESFDKNAVVRNALVVTGGGVRGTRRVDPDVYDQWLIRVRPSGYDDVTVRLPATSDCAAPGALCTVAGGRLEKGATTTVPGPVAVSVADARVEEAEGAELVFAVTLDRARDATVTVDYATEDGSALAGDDYTGTKGTLVFEAGETSKTVKVPVIDDAHDEGEETMVLRLSNAVGARIADGEATGIIENTDHMPKAWLGRFGRTVAEQVLDAVEGRMRAPRAPGAEVRLAGQRLGLGTVFGTEGGEAEAPHARESEAEAAEDGRRLAAWLSGASDEEEGRGLETRPMTPRELLLGSSFSLSAGAADGAGGSASLWGRSAVSRFDGREGELALDGEVASGLLGADWARGRSTAGLVVSHSRGEGGYRASSRSERHFEASSRSERNPGEAGAGTVSSTLTGLYPWGRHALTERVSVWGVAGYGEGTLTLTPEGPDGESGAAMRTDTELVMGSVGVRGVVVEAPSHGGFELSVTGDALGVRTSSDAVRGGGGNLAASEAEVTRLRLGLEGSWRGLHIGTGTLSPRLELGARHDGGDAETGAGLDVGGAVAWSDPARGLRAELGGRGLLTHESGGFGERGVAASLVFDPAPGSERGPSLRLTQTVGARATGGLDALLGPETARALGAAEEDALARRRLEARLGYGFALLGGDWTGVPEVGFALSGTGRETVLGWRLLEARGAGLVFGLDVEGARVERAAEGAAPEHRLGLGFGWRIAGARRESFEVRFEGARVEPGDGAPAHEVGLRLTARW